jgi:Icc-related predicted phosphoesterase
MRLVYTSDLHGDLQSYKAMLALAVSSKAEAVIVGGDLLPHAIKIDVALQKQRDFILSELRPLLEEFHQQHPDIKIYLLAGNDDWFAAIRELDAFERDGLAYPLHERVYRLRTPSKLGATDGLWLAGYACVPLTPYSIKDYERSDDGTMPPYSFSMAYSSKKGTIEPITAFDIRRQPSIADSLQQLSQKSPVKRTIYVCHTPPADCALDTMPRDRHIGSKALRQFIEQQAPLLTLHGHTHESPHLTNTFAIQLGSTWSANPGHDQRSFHGITLDTDDIAGTITHTLFGRPKPA